MAPGRQAFPFVYEIGDSVAAEAQSAIGEPDCRKIWRPPCGVIPDPIHADFQPSRNILGVEQTAVRILAVI